jgi:hypothetical protein
LKAACRRKGGAESGRERGPLRRHPSLNDGEKTQVLSQSHAGIGRRRLGFELRFDAGIGQAKGSSNSSNELGGLVICGGELLDEVASGSKSQDGGEGGHWWFPQET